VIKLKAYEIAFAFTICLTVTSTCAYGLSTRSASGGYSINDADNYLTAENYARAESIYRGLLSEDRTGDAYAGLSVALAKQGTPQKILESEQILRKAKDKFTQNPNVPAAAAFVSFVHAQVIASPAKKDEYLEAAQK
jgi:hypothetical protein